MCATCNDLVYILIGLHLGLGKISRTESVSLCDMCIMLIIADFI